MNTVKIKSTARKPRRGTYHHGDLRRELLAAAEQVLLARGVCTALRYAKRHAGPVFPLLPRRIFAAALLAADAAGGTDPAQRLQEQAYVRTHCCPPRSGRCWARSVVRRCRARPSG